MHLIALTLITTKEKLKLKSRFVITNINYMSMKKAAFSGGFFLTINIFNKFVIIMS